MRKSTKYAIVAVVLIAVLWVSGVFGAIANALSQAGQPAPDAGEVWDIRISRAVYWDTDSGNGVAVTGGTGVIAVGGKTVDFYFARDDFDDADSALDLDLDAVNLNTPEFSGQSFQLILDIGTYSTVQDPAAGTNYPLLDPDNVNPGIPEVTYAGATAGTQIDDTYVVTIDAGSSDAALEAEMSTNAAAFTAMTIGQTYFIEELADSEVFRVLFHPTA